MELGPSIGNQQTLTRSYYDIHVSFIMKAWQVTLSILYLIIIALGFSQECNNEGECDTNNNSNNVQSIRLGLEWFTNPDHLPLIVALHHGIFKDFGLDVDLVVHAAALKQVPVAEYNPFEFIKTNVLGAQNLIECCLGSSVTRVIALSTDKASSPINLYGASKLCSDKIFIDTNNIKGKQNSKFGIVRYGNVMGSRGSVLGTFLEQSKNRIISITDKNMTRFNINMNEAIDLTIYSLINLKGGEIFVPKIHSFRILDLAKALCEK